MNQEYIQEEYNRLASNYDTRWKGYLNSTHSIALQLMEPTANDIILDASGGTGLLTEQIMYTIGKEGWVTLTDISEKMLKIAVQRLKKYPNVQILKNDVHNLQFNSKSFSKVSSINSLHYYINPEKALSEFYRVLQPNGSLIIIDWCRDSLYFKMFNSVIKIANKPHVNTYTSKGLQNLLNENGFKVDKVITWNYGLWPLMGIKATKQ